MLFKFPILLLLLSLSQPFRASEAIKSKAKGSLKNDINTSGFYLLQFIPKSKEKEEASYTNKIYVKLIGKDRIVLLLIAQFGPPAYNSGRIEDTLMLVNNMAVFHTQDDPSCKIIFKFNKSGVTVEEKADNFSMACGLGHGVYVDGFYKKQP